MIGYDVENTCGWGLQDLDRVHSGQGTYTLAAPGLNVKVGGHRADIYYPVAGAYSQACGFAEGVHVGDFTVFPPAAISTVLVPSWISRRGVVS